MIYTLTANPSLDYIMRVNNFEAGETNRAQTTELYPGGKGINVSTILERLGYANTALGFIAGFSGNELVRMLEKRSFEKEFVECNGYTRINVKLKSGEETEINGCGLELEDKDVEVLKKRIAKLEKDDVLILSGSIPSQLNNHFYQELIELAGEDILCAVDATGDLLKNTLPSHPFLIKPNQAELEAFFNEKLDTREALAGAAARLREMGAQNVLVSRGSKGALLAGMDGKFYTSTCPKGKLMNSVGSGDSMVAGFMAGYMKEHSLEQALRLGIYCGSATAFCADLAEKSDIDHLMEISPVEIETFEL